MDIVSNFREYLFSQKNPPGSLTVKNYTADARKFISWFEQTYNIRFSPEGLTTTVVTQYSSAIQRSDSHSLPAVSSVKRYLSSLRKFSTFLLESGLIQINPFIKP